MWDSDVKAYETCLTGLYINSKYRQNPALLFAMIFFK